MMKVFISHSSKDKKFVRTLKDDLNENGIETWFDEDQLDLGDSLLEKLESSLEESTHFIIILSSSSVSSDWVKLELNKAILQVTKKLMHKIIPIKYRECKVPKELDGLLYADLSTEIVQIVDDKVKFTTSGYPNFLNKIIKTLNSQNTKKLTAADKIQLKEEFNETDKQLTEKRKSFARLLMGVDGFASNDSKNTFVDRITDSLSLDTPKLNGNKIRPILLPRITKSLFPNITLGTEMAVNYNDSEFETAHFGGFRRDDSKITIEISLRKELGISKDKIYSIRFDSSDNTIKIFDS
jgi:hypothetical protein